MLLLQMFLRKKIYLHDTRHGTRHGALGEPLRATCLGPQALLRPTLSPNLRDGRSGLAVGSRQQPGFR